MFTITHVMKYYIAVQDGRYNDQEFDTEEEAEAARLHLKKIPMLYESTCVLSYPKKFETQKLTVTNPRDADDDVKIGYMTGAIITALFVEYSRHYKYISIDEFIADPKRRAKIGEFVSSIVKELNNAT